MTTTLEDRGVDERLRRLSAQVDYLVTRAEEDEIRRRSMAELSHDLTPVTRQAMESVGARLDEVDVSVDDVGRFLISVAESLPVLERALGQLVVLSELMADASALSGPAVASMTERLGDLERRGYMDFVRSGMGVVDRIVTSYDEEDVEALGENIVLILDTVKEMTQPEVMGMLRRTFHTVSESDGAPEPPSLFALLREMRQPQARRGLGRVLTMLRSVGDDARPDAGTDS